MAETHRNLKDLDRCGNAPALDFVNTVHSRLEVDSYDYLQQYADLVQWARDGKLISAQDHRTLTEAAAYHPVLARRAVRQARELREVIYRLFVTLIRDEEPVSNDLRAFNKSLGAALGRRRVHNIRGAFEWSWEHGDASLERPLWPVVLSAAELLATGDRRRLKECPEPDGCGWLFLDTSKNGTRRWCNMRTCGNIAKARRYYKRHSGRKNTRSR